MPRSTAQTTVASVADRCFHCELPIPSDTDFGAVLDGVPRRMCCPGCVAVAELIVTTGLGQYYTYRDRPAASPRDSPLPPAEELARYDRPAVQRIFVLTDSDTGRRTTLAIDGLRCTACVWLIEQHVRQQPGVSSIAVSLGTERADVAWREGQTRLSTLVAEIARLGYRAYPYRPDIQEARRREEFRSGLRRLAVAGFGMMQVMVLAVGLYAGAFQGITAVHRDFLRWVSAIMTAPVIGYASRQFFTGAWRDLRNGRAGMDVPIALALIGTYAASLAAAALGTGDVYFESICMFVFFIAIGRFLEMCARHAAARSVEGALRGTPTWATRLVGDGREVVSVFELAQGDVVLVKPGETIPADGEILEGHGWVNEAMLTGEEWPREKRPGDTVVGGTQNGAAVLTVRVDHTGADTVLSSIVRLVDRAARERPPVALLADRVAEVFVPAVLVLALAVGVAWWYIDADRAAWIMLSVLVVSCPCALSLATPAALTAATGHLLRRGLLVTRAHVIEGLAKATDVVFDKTGTLTEGRFRRGRTVPIGALPVRDCLALATRLESYSEHPIARAFPPDGPEFNPTVLVTRSVATVQSCGVEAIVAGRLLRIGQHEWVSELHEGRCAQPPTADAHWILLGGAAGPLAWFEVSDSLRPDALRTVRALAQQGLQVHVVSGDTEVIVKRLAAQLEIPMALGAATPEEKLQYVATLQARGRIVTMVGDGVNDGPALSGAQVSIALGSGTDLARSSADCVLMHEDLAGLADAITTARRARVVIAQNLAWALIYNLVALPLAACGVVAPYWAAVGMSASSLVVLLNALRLGPSGAAALQAAPSAAPWWGLRTEERA